MIIKDQEETIEETIGRMYQITIIGIIEIGISMITEMEVINIQDSIGMIVETVEIIEIIEITEITEIIEIIGTIEIIVIIVIIENIEEMIDIIVEKIANEVEMIDMIDHPGNMIGNNEIQQIMN